MTSPAALRRSLRGLHASVSERLQRIEADRRRIAHALPADFADQATEAENDEVLDRLSESACAELDQISRALEDLDRGHYGTCERCGSPIGAARLRALPAATTCARCADLRT